MNQKEQERRARLMKMQAERLPEIKRRFEESQKQPDQTTEAPTVTGEAVIFEEVQRRNFNSNFKPGGKDAHLVNGRKNSAKPNDRSAKSSKSARPTKNNRNQKSIPKKSTADSRKIDLSVSTKKGDMVHHQRMLPRMSTPKPPSTSSAFQSINLATTATMALKLRMDN